jgi:cysteine synthase
MLISSVVNIKSDNLFFQCLDFLENGNVLLKLEGLNVAGSIKLKTALYLIKNIEKISTINPLQCKFIESSSGNLGVALSIICKEKGYHFTCVTDPNISSANEQQMRLLGTTIVKVTDRDSAGGYLSTRIDYIKKLIHDDPSYIWTNQYANENNINAHYF